MTATGRGLGKGHGVDPMEDGCCGHALCPVVPAVSSQPATFRTTPAAGAHQDRAVGEGAEKVVWTEPAPDRKLPVALFSSLGETTCHKENMESCSETLGRGERKAGHLHNVAWGPCWSHVCSSPVAGA